jgi:hypothetical protein
MPIFCPFFYSTAKCRFKNLGGILPYLPNPLKSPFHSTRKKYYPFFIGVPRTGAILPTVASAKVAPLGNSEKLFS